MVEFFTDSITGDILPVISSKHDIDRCPFIQTVGSFILYGISVNQYVNIAVVYGDHIAVSKNAADLNAN